MGSLWMEGNQEDLDWPSI